MRIPRKSRVFWPRNAWGRLLAARGVVDFFDVGMAGWRFYVFNVADVADSAGGVLLAIASWREGQAAATAVAEPPPTASP